MPNEIAILCTCIVRGLDTLAAPDGIAMRSYMRCPDRSRRIVTPVLHTSAENAKSEKKSGDMFL